jgi:hypothetical protein
MLNEKKLSLTDKYYKQFAEDMNKNSLTLGDLEDCLNMAMYGLRKSLHNVNKISEVPNIIEKSRRRTVMKETIADMVLGAVNNLGSNATYETIRKEYISRVQSLKNPESKLANYSRQLQVLVEQGKITKSGNYYTITDLGKERLDIVIPSNTELFDYEVPNPKYNYETST